jgi:P-type conjugative transfer protein TrbJ
MQKTYHISAIRFFRMGGKARMAALTPQQRADLGRMGGLAAARARRRERRKRLARAARRGASVALVAVLVALAAPVARAQFVCGNCAEEPTQLLNHGELVLSVAKAALILENAIQNTVRQAGTPGNNVGAQLASIAQVLQAGQALNQATANLQGRWNATFSTPPPLPPTTGFHAQFQVWSQATQDSLRAAAFAGAMSHSWQQAAASVINQLEGMIAAADGRMKAMQQTASGTMRTAAGVEALHNTVLTQGSATQVWMQYQLSKDMQQQYFEQKFFAMPSAFPRDNVEW